MTAILHFYLGHDVPRHRDCGVVLADQYLAAELGDLLLQIHGLILWIQNHAGCISHPSDSSVLDCQVDLVILLLFVLLLHLRREERTDRLSRVLRAVQLLLLPGDGIDRHVAEFGALLEDDLQPGGLGIDDHIDVFAPRLADVEEVALLVHSVLLELDELVLLLLLDERVHLGLV